MDFDVIEYAKKNYSIFSNLLFENLIPNSSRIRFKYVESYSIGGYTKLLFGDEFDDSYDFEMAFNDRFVRNETDLCEILIHEMIHIWQIWCVNKERYHICTDYIGHDGVFKTKMANVNAILEENGYPYKIRMRIDYTPKYNKSMNDSDF